LTTLLTALFSLRATTTCLPTWRTSCDCSASAIMRLMEGVKAWLSSLLWHRNTKNLGSMQ
jgi:hypothetical protein